MRDLKDLQNYWRINAEQDLALCTIVGKKGSGYRSAGAKKIIRHDGDFCGYLSGGCLEGGIVAAALSRWNEMPFRQSFSTMSEEDRLMGYQTGCAGVIDILFERLPQDTTGIANYLPFGGKSGVAGVAISLNEKTLGQRRLLAQAGEKTENVYFDPWVAPVSLYVIGCGPSAGTFAEIAPALGWDVTFLDYRQGNTVAERPDVVSKILPVGEICDDIPASPRTAVVVMTHNYEADLAIVAQLNGRNFGYIGCVGPRKRFEQIGQDLEKLKSITLDAAWAEKVHAPAGLKQAHAPEDIAFSILAEIQFGMAA